MKNDANFFYSLSGIFLFILSLLHKFANYYIQYQMKYIKCKYLFIILGQDKTIYNKESYKPILYRDTN